MLSTPGNLFQKGNSIRAVWPNGTANLVWVQSSRSMTTSFIAGCCGRSSCWRCESWHWVKWALMLILLFMQYLLFDYIFGVFRNAIKTSYRKPIKPPLIALFSFFIQFLAQDFFDSCVWFVLFVNILIPYLMSLIFIWLILHMRHRHWWSICKSIILLIVVTIHSQSWIAVLVLIRLRTSGVMWNVLHSQMRITSCLYFWNAVNLFVTLFFLPLVGVQLNLSVLRGSIRLLPWFM